MCHIRINPRGEALYKELSKDPSDVIDLLVDYTQYFKTDTITTITVVGTNITVDSSSVSANVVTIWLSAGDACTTASVKITVSSSTRTLERTIKIKIENK